MAQNKSPGRKRIIATVISDKMDKTIIARVHWMQPHPEYSKLMKKAIKFKVHDEQNSAKIGDKVEIEETRPLSKEKRWRLVRIIGTAVKK